jgi:hypothetical protein
MRLFDPLHALSSDFYAAAHHSRSCSTHGHPTLAARLRILAPPIGDFPNLPALQPAGVMDDLARCGKRPTGPYRRVTGRGRLFPSTGTSASRAYPGHTRSPADFKVAAARELRHSTVRCSDGILAAAAPDGTEAADAAVRLKARVGRVHDLQELSTKPHRRRHSLAGPRRH